MFICTEGHDNRAKYAENIPKKYNMKFRSARFGRNSNCFPMFQNELAETMPQ